MAAILKRSGCIGSASTNQPQKAHDVPEVADNGTTRPAVIIKHFRVRLWAELLRARGYNRIVAICVVREKYATVQSQLAHGHAQVPANAVSTHSAKIAAAVHDGFVHCDELHVTSFEGLSEPALRHFLPMIGLPYVDGPLLLDGQNTGDGVSPALSVSTNRKHY